MEHGSDRAPTLQQGARCLQERQLFCIELVQRCTDLIDELQRERGLGQLVLSTLGESYTAALQEQFQLSREAETALRLHLQLDPHSAGGAAARLAPHGDQAHEPGSAGELELLRRRVLLLQCSRQEMFETYCRRIEGLLALAQSAGPASGDPGLGSELATLLHLMRGKECSGRERASGTGLYAGGRNDARCWQELRKLIEAQQFCASRFICLASPGARRLLKETLQLETQSELERLRQQLADTPDQAVLDPTLAEVWFRSCSRRMNELREVERQLLQALRAGLQADPARRLAAQAPAPPARSGRASATAVAAVPRTASA